MPGEPDRLYIEARRALLDALEALAPHRDSLILVGAQAVYLHTGEADVAVAPYTKDADVAIDPRHLGAHPVLDDAMQAAGFEPGDQPGIWKAAATMAQVDLLVPDTLGGPGRHRGAHIEGHGRRAARRVAGIEGALVDNASMSIGSLEASDSRRVELRVAGPAALLVSKLHKLGEGQERPDRLLDKDALDVYRLLVAVPTASLTACSTPVSLRRPRLPSHSHGSPASGRLARPLGIDPSPDRSCGRRDRPVVGGPCPGRARHPGRSRRPRLEGQRAPRGASRYRGRAG